MTRRAFAALLLIMAASGARAVESRDAPGFAIVKPKPEWGGIALAVINLDASDDLAPGYYCPPEPDEPASDGSGTICLGAAMFDQNGSIQRLLATTPDFGAKRYGTFRTIGGHAARSTRGGWFIALMEQTDDGYTWVPWQAPLDRGRACLPKELIEAFSIRIPADATSGEAGGRCFKAWRSF